MTKLDLKDFERKIRSRSLTVDDYEAVIEMQRRSFPGMKTWLREQFESQIRMFPEGQVCVEYQGRIVASSSSLIVDFTEYSEWHSWKDIADNGFIRNHDPAGDTLYGIEIMVDPRYRGLKLARRLYDERKRIAREHNLGRIIIGGRIPGYGQHANKMSAREYVEKVIAKSLVRSGSHDAALQRIRAEAAHPRLFPRRQRVARLRDLPGVGEPGLMLLRPGASPCARRRRFGSAWCSTSCGASGASTTSGASARTSPTWPRTRRRTSSCFRSS